MNGVSHDTHVAPLPKYSWFDEQGRNSLNQWGLDYNIRLNYERKSFSSIKRRILASFFFSAQGLMDLGLGRVQALLRRVGSPHVRFPVIHVAGTNGKGSTTAYLDAFLTHAVGIRSARFNSPHLITARDSVRINGGEPIDELTWNMAVRQTCLADARDVPIGATPFELLTVQALLAFTLLPKSKQPDVLLMEVGVGGRLDATNVFPNDHVLASVICPVARDHETILGNSLSDIAREKAGIIKPHGLCVIADQAPVSYCDDTQDSSSDSMPADLASSDILRVLHEICCMKQARVVYSRVASSSISSSRQSETHVFEAPIELHVPLYGAHDACVNEDFYAHREPEVHVSVPLEATVARISGASTALQTLWSVAHDTPSGQTIVSDAWHQLRAQIRTHLFESHPDVSKMAIACAARQYRWEGRCEWKSLLDSSGTSIPVLLDGAHNQASALALRQYIDLCIANSNMASLTITWILGFSNGKDVKGMLHALVKGQKRVSHRLLLVPFSTPVEGMPWIKPFAPDAIVPLVEDMRCNIEAVATCATLKEALDSVTHAKQPTPLASPLRSSPQIVVVCGSLYLVSDYYRAMKSSQ